MSIVAKRPDGSRCHLARVGLGPHHFLRNGDPDPSAPKGFTSSHFSAHVYCAQTAGWIKMPLGMKVGLGQRHIAHSPPIFGPCISWPRSPISAATELFFVGVWEPGRRLMQYGHGRGLPPFPATTHQRHIQDNTGQTHNGLMTLGDRFTNGRPISQQKMRATQVYGACAWLGLCLLKVM